MALGPGHSRRDARHFPQPAPPPGREFSAPMSLAYRDSGPPATARAQRASAHGAAGPASRARLWMLLLGTLLSSACATRRILSVESEPPGAQVRLDDELIGRTPLEYDFEHYGGRRLTLYLGGYRTWSAPLELERPWHARFPIDLITEVLIPMGLTDRHHVSVELEPDLELAEELDFSAILEHAREVRETVARARLGQGAESAPAPTSAGDAQAAQPPR